MYMPVSVADACHEPVTGWRLHRAAAAVQVLRPDDARLSACDAGSGPGRDSEPCDTVGMPARASAVGIEPSPVVGEGCGINLVMRACKEPVYITALARRLVTRHPAHAASNGVRPIQGGPPSSPADRA